MRILINFVKTIIKSNKLFIILGEKIATNLNINFEDEYLIASYVKSPIIIDVGAHIGESIFNFKKNSINSKIYSFEPNKNLFKKLEKVKKRYKNVKIYNYALSNTKIQNLYVPSAYGIDLSLWSTLNLNYLKNRWINFTNINFKKISLKKIKIRSKKLDYFKINPHIIKIDAEGSEYEIIKSAKKTISKNLPILIIEFHNKNYKKIKFELKKYGYSDYIFSSKNNKLIKINNSNINQIRKKKTSTNLVFYCKHSNLLQTKLID